MDSDCSGDTCDTKHESISVAVRVRPLAAKEKSQSSDFWTYPSSESIRDSTGRVFVFDRVYPGDSQTQTIFEDIAERVILNAVEGFSGCIFCYGQTGSGKTFTMHGYSKQSPGLVFLGVQTLFAFMEEADECEFLVRCSYMEIYNECVNDLINPNATNLKLMELRSKKVSIQGLTESVCNCAEQVYSLLQLGEANKQVASTNFNQRSSRSHTLFRLVLESKGNTRSDVTFSSVNFIDLAGSECASAHNFGDSPKSVSRKREMSCINKSLLTLSTVIMRLSDEHNSAPIPFRESKLTRLLKDSLEGQAKVSIICTISPTTESFEEAVNTLKFAMKAKKIKQAISKTVSDPNSLLLKYQHEIETLRNALHAMESRIAAESEKSTEPLKQQVESLDMALQAKDFENLELYARLDAMNDKLTSMLNEKLEIQTKLEMMTQQIVRAESLRRTKMCEHMEVRPLGVEERVHERVQFYREKTMMKTPIVSARNSIRVSDFKLTIIPPEKAGVRKDSDSLSSEESPQLGNTRVSTHLQRASSHNPDPVHLAERLELTLKQSDDFIPDEPLLMDERLYWERSSLPVDKLRFVRVQSMSVFPGGSSEVAVLRKALEEKDEVIARLTKELQLSKTKVPSVKKK